MSRSNVKKSKSPMQGESIDRSIAEEKRDSPKDKKAGKREKGRCPRNLMEESEKDQLIPLLVLSIRVVTKGGNKFRTSVEIEGSSAGDEKRGERVAVITPSPELLITGYREKKEGGEG